MATNKIVLVVLDGWGLAPAWGGNAVSMAQKPVIDGLWWKRPHTTLKAAEEAVGLPVHEPGNSEVGHLNIGCGQIVKQNLPGISQTIESGAFFQNPVLLGAIEHAKKNSSNLHLIGLVSDGGVHSHISHLFALLDLAQKNNFNRVYIHMITDGRDTDPMKALIYLEKLEAKLKELNFGQVVSVMGRYYAMDRDHRWERIQKAYDLLTVGAGEKFDSPMKAISSSYRDSKTDEFIVPCLVSVQDKPFTPVKDNDAVIFFNFRSDRANELTEAFMSKKFKGFDRQKVLQNIYFATFAFREDYEDASEAKIIFRPEAIQNPLAKILSDNNLKQFHIAETEKYAHVTYFFNGGRQTPFPGEDHLLIPSPKVPSYDVKPEMSAKEVTDKVLEKMGGYDFTVVNYANPDMVGHTGNLKAAVQACEFIDGCIGRIVERALAKNIVTIITADHGNVEQMINPNTSEPHTEHTLNPVPFIVVSDIQGFQAKLKDSESQELALRDVAPTILNIMGIEKPAEMTGQSLLG